MSSFCSRCCCSKQTPECVCYASKFKHSTMAVCVLICGCSEQYCTMAVCVCVCVCVCLCVLICACSEQYCTMAVCVFICARSSTSCPQAVALTFVHLISVTQVLEQNSLTEFFQINDVNIHDWMMQPSAVEDIINSSHQVCVYRRAACAGLARACRL